MRLRRHLSLLLLVLLVATAALTVSAKSPAAHELTDTEKGNTAAAPTILEVSDATLSAATTGCGLCQQTGYCDHAFKGSPGQFCLTLATGLPCCCPRDAQCAANVYSCRCRRTGYYPPAPPAPPASPDGAKSVSLFSLFAMLLCVGCCVCACCKRQRDERHDRAAYQPVYATAATTGAPPQYGATDQAPPNKYAYAYPSAPPPPSDAYNAYNAPYATPVTTDAGYMNPYAAGAVGAAAGLAGGMLVGSALSGGGGNNSQPSGVTTTFFDGDSGFANGTSSYEFAGDGGDYGGGDDGGDFGGDS